MKLPLEGIRIVDNGIVQAGTFPARLLSDFGAEVIRVENYVRPDISRNAVFPKGIAAGDYWEAGGVYHEQHRNKSYCIGLDVRKPLGREAFLQLVRVSDVVLDSHPPGVMEKLALAYSDIKGVNDRAIYVTTSGYGHGGPYSSLRSYGMMTEVMCGSGWLNGYEGEEARRGACPLTDHPSTYHIAFLIMAALIKRRRSGRGIWLDISQYEIAVNLLGDAHLANSMGVPVPTRAGNRDPGATVAGCFPSKGHERWITLAIPNEAAWQRFVVLVRGALPEGDPLEDEMVAIVRQWTTERTADEAFRALSAIGVPASPVNDVRDLLLDEHLKERGFFWLVAHEERQQAGVRAWPGMSVRIGDFVSRPVRAPMLGEHNRQVALEILRYTPEKFEELVAEGVFGTTPSAAGAVPTPENIAARPTLGPSALRRSKTYDEDHLATLRARFGEHYG